MSTHNIGVVAGMFYWLLVNIVVFCGVGYIVWRNKFMILWVFAAFLIYFLCCQLGIVKDPKKQINKKKINVGRITCKLILSTGDILEKEFVGQMLPSPCFTPFTAREKLEWFSKSYSVDSYQVGDRLVKAWITSIQDIKEEEYFIEVEE